MSMLMRRISAMIRYAAYKRRERVTEKESTELKKSKSSDKSNKDQPRCFAIFHQLKEKKNRQRKILILSLSFSSPPKLFFLTQNTRRVMMLQQRCLHVMHTFCVLHDFVGVYKLYRVNLSMSVVHATQNNKAKLFIWFVISEKYVCCGSILTSVQF